MFIHIMILHINVEIQNSVQAKEIEKTQLTIMRSNYMLLHLLSDIYLNVYRDTYVHFFKFISA